jgi:hypothetical protein
VEAIKVDVYSPRYLFQSPPVYLSIFMVYSAFPPTAPGCMDLSRMASKIIVRSIGTGSFLNR